LGVIVIGNGLGIIFSGLIVPVIDVNFHAQAWRISWIIFALLTLAIAFFIKKGLRLHDNKVEKDDAKTLAVFSQSAFWKISSLYFIFGVTYVIYVTFFVAAAIDKYDLDIEQSGYFWLLLGAMSLLSGPLFGSIADKVGAYKTLILIYFCISISYFILTLDVPSTMLFLSVTLFGSAAWVIPSLVTLLTSIEFGKEKTAQVFSFITIVFAIGQTIGPVAAGFIFDLTSNFKMVFSICAVLTTFGMILSFLFSRGSPKQRKKPE